MCSVRLMECTNISYLMSMEHCTLSLSLSLFVSGYLSHTHHNSLSLSCACVCVVCERVCTFTFLSTLFPLFALLVHTHTHHILCPGRIFLKFSIKLSNQNLSNQTSRKCIKNLVLEYHFILHQQKMFRFVTEEINKNWA